MLFSEYLFADYSGSFSARRQRNAIRLAAGSDRTPPSTLQQGLTREELVEEFVERLASATRRGVRVWFGQDHQYGVPIGLLGEVGLFDLPWRRVLKALCTGSYGATIGPSGPPLGHPRLFARAFNEWLVSRGRPAYFYSATKSDLYGVPRHNPRSRDRRCYRLTELCRPDSGAGMPEAFNRLGDNGTVGGQSLVGMQALHNLLLRCEQRRISVRAWPFDGLSILDSAYRDAHVLIEPYPTAVRAPEVAQSDESDALACADHVRSTDRAGLLAALLDLSELGTSAAVTVVVEGWIMSHRPEFYADYAGSIR